MAKVRVHELAKEFGMTSKEMLEHLQEMKIPAKVASSALEDAYVNLVRKNLAPILEQRAAKIEEARRAEEQARLAEEQARLAEEEKARQEAEARREEERRVEAERRAAEEARRAEEERRRAEEEAKRKAEEERRMHGDNAPKSTPSFTSLLEQIAQQERVLAAQKEKEKEQPAQKGEARPGDASRRDRSKRGGANAGAGSRSGVAPAARGAEAAPQETRSKQKGHKAQRQTPQQQEEPAEDHYARMAREAQEYSRDRILAEAREAIAEATRESGRRKKRKERREAAAEEQRHEAAIKEALANDQNPDDLDIVKISEGATVSEFAEALDVSANDIIKRLFLLGSPLTLTQTMSNDLIELIADDLGRRVKIMTPEEGEHRTPSSTTTPRTWWAAPPS